VSVSTQAQQPFRHQRIKRHLGNRSVEAAEALHLFSGQSQTWHLQELGTETIQHVVNRSHHECLPEWREVIAGIRRP
jgi:hypothetical protein